MVVGAGPVGASLARAVRGMSVALVAHEKRVARAREGFDARVYALSPGNADFLRGLGTWPADRATPVHAMRIFGDAGSSIGFDAYDAGVPALAWIVEDAVLQDALWSGLEVEVIAPAHGESLSITGESAGLRLREGGTLEAKLIVGADGASSFVRGAAGIAATERDYGQIALVANFRCEKPHGNVAYQWFQNGAVLALLPLPGNHVSMVWSRAREPEDLCKEVSAAAGAVLGEFELVTPARSYPLRRLSARSLVSSRVALAGDAGHVIHPLAGQGLNLGLQDARVLAETLLAREPGRDPGELRLLRRYERARAEPIRAMAARVDGLFRLFGAEGRGIEGLRNAGLNLTDRLPVIKNMLMRHAMA